MTPGEKAELLRKKESFDKLSAVEQGKLRRLHEEIRNDKDSEELRRIMHDYYEWWKSLPPYYRAELSSLSTEERIERIRQLKAEELKRNPIKNLSDKDTKALREWMEEYVKKFEDSYREYQKSLTPEERKKWADKSPQQRRRDMMRFIGQQWQRGGNKAPPSPEDLAALRSKLTPETQKLLEAKPPAEQWQTIRSWLHSLARQQFAAQFGRGPGSLVEEKELEEFFESDKLEPQERERLLNLPPEQMHNQLQQLYLSRKKPFESIFPRPDGMPPGGPRSNSDWRRPNFPEKAPDKS